jgi:hypothetical protein
MTESTVVPFPKAKQARPAPGQKSPDQFLTIDR